MATSMIQGLLDQRAYPHPTDTIQVIETHISWVVCTGTFAYKIKKPVNLGFLDFSTLENRRFYCHEELRLNRILAPQLYLDVVSITGTVGQPHMDGQGTPIEYAVKLRQFDPACQFDNLLKDGQLAAHHIDDVVETLVLFHANTERLNDDRSGFADSVHQPVRENYHQALSRELSPDLQQRLLRLRDWHDAEFSRLRSTIENRLTNGFIRECHGDLHLGNIVYYEKQVLLFDRLEFDPQLRFIDVINEIAFLLMDLEAHGQQELGHRFISRWLQHSGDYAGLYLLNYYKCYRSMVRAKVALIRNDSAEFLRYLQLAEKSASPRNSALILTHGLSGSGKSTITQPLAPLINAIIVRSDVERKRHLQGQFADLYSSQATRQTYELLASAAAAIISAGYHALIDATFLKREQRQQFLTLARQLNVPCIILDFQAPRELLIEWINDRIARGSDVSDANVAVLEQQISNQEQLTTDEKRLSLIIDTSHRVDVTRLATVVQARINAHDHSATLTD